jgi:choline dehydrogenase
VSLTSADPLDAPAMQPNYLTAPEDRRCAIAAVRFARKLAATRALRPYIAEEVRPGKAMDDADDTSVLEFCREYGATIFHPSGTCRMGPDDDDTAVVDARLRVRGVDALRVVDCSIMPTLVSGNTNAPVVMIAEKASDMIAADAR